MDLPHSNKPLRQTGITAIHPTYAHSEREFGLKENFHPGQRSHGVRSATDRSIVPRSRHCPTKQDSVLQGLRHYAGVSKHNLNIHVRLQVHFLFLNMLDHQINSKLTLGRAFYPPSFHAGDQSTTKVL